MRIYHLKVMKTNLLNEKFENLQWIAGQVDQWVESSMIPEFQNGSGIPELSPEWFWNPEPFWHVPKYVPFHIF